MPPKHLSRFTISQLRELSAAAGMEDPDIAAAVAMAESGGNPSAVGDQGTSIGLWQIHVPTCPKNWANPDALKHPGVNVQAAFAISSGGTDWQPWTTFRNGAYKRFMPH